MCKEGTLLAVNSAWCQLGISGVLAMYSFLNINMHLIMLVISTEAAYCTALCWTVGHSKSRVPLLYYSLWQDWHPPLLRCILGAWIELSGGRWCTQIISTGSLSTRMDQDGIWMFSYYVKADIAVHQPSPLCSRPVVCFSGASFFIPALYPLPSHFLASHTHVLFLFFLHIPNFFLHSPGFSFLWPPGDLSCALWLPLSDVAHHRAQHALNKPSNPKTPQGTILFAPHTKPVDVNRCHPSTQAGQSFLPPCLN